jgi:hypothetical protein
VFVGFARSGDDFERRDPRRDPSIEFVMLDSSDVVDRRGRWDTASSAALVAAEPSPRSLTIQLGRCGRYLLRLLTNAS